MKESDRESVEADREELNTLKKMALDRQLLQSLAKDVRDLMQTASAQQGDLEKLKQWMRIKSELDKGQTQQIAALEKQRDEAVGKVADLTYRQRMTAFAAILLSLLASYLTLTCQLAEHPPFLVPRDRQPSPKVLGGVAAAIVLVSYSLIWNDRRLFDAAIDRIRGNATPKD